MFLKVIFRTRRSLLRAEFARFGNQILLANDSTFEPSNESIPSLRFLLRAARKQKVHSGHDQNDRADGGEPKLELVVERGGIIRHLFCDGDSFECRVGNLLAFDRDSRFFAQLFLRAEHSQLVADTS